MDAIVGEEAELSTMDLFGRRLPECSKLLLIVKDFNHEWLRKSGVSNCKRSVFMKHEGVNE